MIPPLKTSFAAGILSLLGLAAAPATVIVTTSATAPASSFASSTVVAGGLQWRNSTEVGRRDVGQSFYVPTTLTLDAITFQLAADAAPGLGALTSAFSLSIYQVAGSGSVPTGAALHTESGNLSGLTGTSADFSKYVTFDLTNVALTGGNYYAIILSFPTQASNQNVTWQVSGASPTYTGGMAITSTDGTSFSGWGGGSDLVFYTTAVPEPGIAALSLLGLALITFRIRARQNHAAKA